MYMALHACAECGDERFTSTVGMSFEDGELVTRYVGPCHTCPATREFRFLIDDEFAVDGETVPLVPGEPEFGRATPSEIIDPGQWLRCADRILETTPTNVLGLDEAECQARRFLFKAAAESVGEVLKFIPEGAEEVPPQCFWTADGRTLYELSPDRFRRAELERLRLAYLDLTERYAA
jgi:hypothetical protein